MTLEIACFEETDTLSLWNGTPASEARDRIAGGALGVNDNMGSAVIGNIIVDYERVSASAVSVTNND